MREFWNSQGVSGPLRSRVRSRLDFGGWARARSADHEQRWAFAELAGGESANKASDQALRPEIILLTLLFAERIASGRGFVETLLAKL